MSWKGFTKAVARLPQTLSTKTGYAQETVDSEFIDMEDKFKSLESCVRKLHEDSRKFKDALSLMLDHQKQYSDTLQVVYQPISSLKSGASNTSLDADSNSSPDIQSCIQFSRITEKVKAELTPYLQDIDRLVVSPSAEFLTIFENTKKYFTKRSHKLLDFDRYRESVKKLKEKKEKTSSDEKKLYQMESSLDQATREYNNYNNLLKSELPIFLGLRIDFVDPCFATFYSCQLKVYNILLHEFRQLADTNFDMKCSAINGYNSKKDIAEALLAELTIPKRRNAAPSESPVSSFTSPTPSNLSAPSNLSSPAISKVDTIPPAAGFAALHLAGAASSLPPANYNIPAPMYTELANSKKYVIALYDFEAQAEGDLSFKRDDKIEVVEKTDNQNDWWTGRLNGATGQFPGNYVTDCN